MIKVSLNGKFESLYRELLRDMPWLENVVFEKTLLFSSNPNDTRLKNHPLTKRLQGKWAFSINDDIRIVYEWLGKNTVRFLAIGSHGNVYKRN